MVDVLWMEQFCTSWDSHWDSYEPLGLELDHVHLPTGAGYVDIDYEIGGFFNIIRYTPVTTVFDVC
jgi:hypothetical protein